MRGVPAMRAQRAAAIVIEEIARASGAEFRVLHFSVQDDHVHLIAEGNDGERFSRGMQQLASRIARRVNMLVGRRGRCWRERYHRRDLATPPQFRNAVVYVTFNFRKHARPREKVKRAREIDGLSSGLWIEQWSDDGFARRMAAREARSTRVAAVAGVAASQPVARLVQRFRASERLVAPALTTGRWRNEVVR